MIPPLAQGFSDSRRAKLTSERQQVVFHVLLVMIDILICMITCLSLLGRVGAKCQKTGNMSDEGY